MTQPDRAADGRTTLSDEEWVALCVPRFVEIRPRYAAYAAFLRTVLEAASRKLAPQAIVESRAKATASFAEKILRKRSRYNRPSGVLPPDPLIRMTDLCGGRVIAQTSAHVQAMCRFIEEAFDVDWSNSEDASRRLRPTEFGYRSVHYVVSINPEKLRAAGVSVTADPEILGLKAEVQIRTLLEHAWADIGHDMSYKTDLKIPDRIRRQFASLAAVLEGVDRQLASMLADLDAFKSNFGAYHARKEVEAEIARLRIVLAQGSGDADMAVRIAQLALGIGSHQLALEVLEPFAAEPHQGVQRVRGLALVELHWDNPRGKEFIEGRRSLEAACTHRHKDAETLCALAETWTREDESKARALFREAVAADATEPVTLSRYLEFEIAHASSRAVIHLAEPMIRSAVERCRKQIEARMNLPWAWASLSFLQLLLDQPYESLESLAQLIRLCEPGGIAADDAGVAASSPSLSAAARALGRTADAAKRIECIREKLPGFDWCQRAIVLGLAAGAGDPAAIDALRRAASWGSAATDAAAPHIVPADHLVLLAGGCSPEVETAVDALRPVLLRACDGLAFTLFCGGTTSGISGLAGDLAAQSADRIRAYGYLPGLLPRGASEDVDPSRYARRFSSSGSGFSPLEPLQAWTDIVASGVDPRRVKLVCYGGGRISRIECMLALAVGARVGVIDDPALPVDRRFADSEWQDCPNLVRLPMDAMALRAFLLMDRLPDRRDDFAAAARRSHEEYVRTAIPEGSSLVPWGDLPEDLKLSNFHQVAYAANILETAGLGLRPITDAAKPPVVLDEMLGEGGVARLAEMEHGRWTVERLLLGWRYAETKDVGQRLSPHLVPWTSVSPEIQRYDLDAIRSLPAKFREAGLDIYRRDEG
jgi:ppGpp synthetase/RelA/SpoT-type nucleotidyltranferase